MIRKISMASPGARPSGEGKLRQVRGGQRWATLRGDNGGGGRPTTAAARSRPAPEWGTIVIPDDAVRARGRTPSGRSQRTAPHRRRRTAPRRVRGRPGSVPGPTTGPGCGRPAADHGDAVVAT